jgi:hypothetical protein
MEDARVPTRGLPHRGPGLSRDQAKRRVRLAKGVLLGFSVGAFVGLAALAAGDRVGVTSSTSSASATHGTGSSTSPAGPSGEGGFGFSSQPSSSLPPTSTGVS